MINSPNDDGPCQRCGKPSEIILKTGQQFLKGKVRYLPDRRLSDPIGDSMLLDHESGEGCCKGGRHHDEADLHECPGSDL